MKKFSEMSLVSFVAKLSPWVAPIPSSFFVARSCYLHLELPLTITIVIGFVIESLGLTSIHTFLLLQNWNFTKKKNEPKAPVGYAVIMVLVYLFSTISLSIFLETTHIFIKFVPALFPILAIVGSFNIALLSQHEFRVKSTQLEHQELKAERQLRRQQRMADNSNSPYKNLSKMGLTYNSLDIANQARKDKKTRTLDAILDIIQDNPEICVSDIARTIGRSRQTIYNYLSTLEDNGKVLRTENGFGISIN